MTQTLIDTVIQLKQCGRCKGYVFFCQVSGVKTATDLKPLSVEEYRDAIIAGKSTYDVVRQAGKPWKLKLRLPSSQWPPYAGRSIVAEHPCTKAMNMAGVELIDPPVQPRANAIEQHGVTQGSYALNDSGKSFQALAAKPVIHHRSREYVRKKCEACHSEIGTDYRVVGVQIGESWVWIRHDYDCLSRKDWLEPNSQCRCGVDVFTLDSVSVDIEPVEDETGLVTYSHFNGRLRLRDDKWRHPQVTHGQGTKNRGWSSNEPYCTAYKEHSCET